MNNNNDASKAFLLQADGVGKCYDDGAGQTLQVLKKIDFTVAASDTIAIIGSSGSGKTTLLNILGGLDDASSGRVLLNGEDIELMDDRQRSRMRNRHMGFVYQFHHLLPEFTALENVAMPLLIAGEQAGVAAAKAAALLTEIGLQHRLHHKPAELSGGERQRAAIARAVVHRPDCVFADEPTGNLDKANAEQAMELILQLNRQYRTALVVVTHDENIAARMQKTYRIEDGVLLD